MTQNAPVCAHCGIGVERNLARYEVFEKMHWAYFHYEFEHDPFDPDEECNAGGCPSAHLDSPPRQLRQ